MRRLLQPKSVAVIGGGGWCANVLAELSKIGFDGPVWHVHPSKGFACVADLPGVPDAAFVGVNRTASVEVVRALAARGTGGVVCFASGFSEAAGELSDAGDVQAALLDAAGEMPVLGPNCYGVLNLLDRVALWPDQHGTTPCSNGVAIVTQSSNIAINLTMQARGLPIGYVVTAGNQAQQGLAEIGRAVLSDPRVTALGLHIEGVADPAALHDLALAAAENGKAIVALKVGVSDQAQAATVSHTASLAGSDAGAGALLRRLGIARVSTLEGFLEALKIAHLHGRLPHADVASLSCSGGEASLMADLGAVFGVTYPPLEPAQVTRLRTALGPRVALANPLDYHTYIWGDEGAMADAFAAMMTPAHALGLLVLDVPREDRCDAIAWEPAFRAVARAQRMTGRPMAILSSLPETLPEELAHRLMQEGLLPLCGLAAALEAIGAMAVGPPEPQPPAPPRPQRSACLVDEPRAKARLSEAGLCIPRGVICEAQDAAAQASAIGFPVVLKTIGAAHKSASGGVHLGLSDPTQVRAAARGNDRVFIEQMVPGAVAELLVGVVADPAHGLVLTLGRGGIETELHADVIHALLPVTADDVRSMLAQLRMAPLFDGFRGRPSADIAAIVRAVLSVQDFVLANAAAVEVEINPLLCLPDGAVAVDALIREAET